MKRRTAWFLVAAVAAVAVGAALVGAVAFLMRGPGGAPWGGPTYLRLTLDGNLPENPSGAELGWLFERRPPALRTLVESLDRAAKDPKVQGVVLRIGSLDAGWGKVQEIRDAVLRFERSGKPAYARVEFCGNKEYYLVSACSRIEALPTAILDISGLSAEVTFLRGTLDKLGVEAQFEGFGKYKDAPNQFTETGFTAPHREQMNSILDALDRQFVQAIAEGRKKTPDEVRALIDGGPYDAKAALEAGLVDDLVYRDEVETRLGGAEAVGPASYVRSSRGFGWDGRPRVALIFVLGEIVSGESGDSPFGGQVAGADTVARALKKAREDSDVRAILLRVDSPGGSGTASDVIWREVELTKAVKPVVVSMGDLGASGGYYVSMGSSAIVSEPGTLTGSIGVFGGKFSFRGLYDKLGISKEILTRGAHADLFSDYRPWTPEERERFRGLMKAFYDDFVSRVAKGRGKTRQQIQEVAQGRVWTGSQAKAVGLVDELGGLDAALALAKKKAGIPKDQDVRLEVLPEPKGLFETLVEREEPGVAIRALPSEVRAVLRWTSVLRSDRVIARLPWEIGIR